MESHRSRYEPSPSRVAMEAIEAPRRSANEQLDKHMRKVVFPPLPARRPSPVIALLREWAADTRFDTLGLQINTR